MGLSVDWSPGFRFGALMIDYLDHIAVLVVFASFFDLAHLFDQSYDHFMTDWYYSNFQNLSDHTDFCAISYVVITRCIDVGSSEAILRYFSL